MTTVKYPWWFIFHSISNMDFVIFHIGSGTSQGKETPRSHRMNAFWDLSNKIKIMEVKFYFIAETKSVSEKSVLYISSLLASSAHWVHYVVFDCYIYFASPLIVSRTIYPHLQKFISLCGYHQHRKAFFLFFIFIKVGPPERQLLCFQRGTWGGKEVPFFICTYVHPIFLLT